MSDTIAAIATGPAPGAIGILRLSGPEAIAAASAVFRPLGGKSLEAYGDRTASPLTRPWPPFPTVLTATPGRTQRSCNATAPLWC